MLHRLLSRYSLMLSVLLLSSFMLLFDSQSHLSAQTGDCIPSNYSRSEWAMTDFCTSSVGMGSIVQVLGRDRIPAVDNPEMETVEAASEWLGERSPVIVVEINGEVRAYPLAILMWHEIANDTVGGVPVSVTFCPLCNSSIVFDRRVNDALLSFGVSGSLRNSDLIMYDRETESWWQQFTGEGIVGTYTGQLLEIIPSTVVGFNIFAERYPDGLVMSRDTGAERSYGINPYAGYDDRGPYERFFDPQGVDSRLFATERVLAGVIDGQAVAYSFGLLREEVVINDNAGMMPVVAFWQSGTNTALGGDIINTADDIGTAVLFSRELDGQVLTFTYASDHMLMDNETGSIWNIFGEAVSGELTGKTLTQLPAAAHFWFAWAAFQPDTLLHKQS